MRKTYKPFFVHIDNRDFPRCTLFAFDPFYLWAFEDPA